MTENSTCATPASEASASDGPFQPLLTTHNWNEEWKQLQTLRHRFDSAEHWDKRSETFATKDAPNPYVERFLELAGIQPHETVFDMGCGTGALSVPLGKQGHSVIAGDFSQGMLDKLQQELDAHHLTTVEPKLMSWSDDWLAHGVAPNSVDVALASRSIATSDLEDALMRLTEVARRRVCITLATGSSPRVDECLLDEIGLRSRPGRDYLYAFTILANRGLMPEVSYISSARMDTFDSAEEAFDTLTRMVDDVLPSMPPSTNRASVLERLRVWLDSNLVSNEHVGEPDKKGVPEKRLRLSRPRIVTWAFIAWNK